MVVRIRYARLRPPDFFNWRHVAVTLAALLTPCALIAFTMAFWVIASEMRWTGEFFISGGLLSRWQVWLAASGVLLVLARLLDRISQGWPARE
jgi:hypothetical protein